MIRETIETAEVDLGDGSYAVNYADATRIAPTSTGNGFIAERVHSRAQPPQLEGHTQQKKMILMRGLPSCGKTTTARQLTEQGGVHIEFDEFFYTQVGKNPAHYDWSAKLLPAARRWNYERIKQALISAASPIVVDSDNSPDATTRAYVKLALYHNYHISFMEPVSPWWRDIRRLLDDKTSNSLALKNWAQKLVGLSRGTHRVPLETFLRRIEHWENLTLETLLSTSRTSVE